MSTPGRDVEAETEAILAELRSLGNPDNVAGMARFGIRAAHILGISVGTLRSLARTHRRDHSLALSLWASGIHEARILASMIANPAELTWEQAESWALDFDSWDVCDQTCNNLFARTVMARRMALEWSSRSEEYVKRAGFSVMASIAAHDADLSDESFEELLVIIAREANDPRNYVKKAVSWALRQIGKRNRALNASAVRTTESIRESGDRAARWIASDALRELTGTTVQHRLRHLPN
jgi:3-methyladenine DNA glycosylase AlkD